MTQMTLTKTRLTNGIWEGALTGAGDTEPQLQAKYQGEAVPGLRLHRDAAHDVWRVELPIPVTLISDGLQTFIIQDGQGQTLASFALLAGDALSDDIRTEMDLLRQELDLLKKAFRQHCQNS